MTDLVTTVYCRQCDRTLVMKASADKKLLKAARRRHPTTTARLNQARADYLTTHQMECAA